MRKLINILLGGAVAVLALLCVGRHFQLAMLTAALQNLPRPVQAVAAQNPAPKPLPEPRPAQNHQPEPAVQAATNAAEPAAQVAELRQPLRVKERPREEFLRMLNDPKRKMFMEAAWTLELDQRYGPLLRYFEMTPEEMRYLKSLLLEKRSRADTFSARLLAATGDAAARTAVQQERDQAAQELDGRLREFLGGDPFEEYQGYERSLPERMMLHDFKIVADNAGAPLGYGQEDKLIRMMNEERAAVPELSELYDNEGEAVAVTRDRGLEIVRAVNVWHDRVLMRAKDLLDERQMYFFEGQVQQIRDVIEVGISMAPLVMEGQ